jgi:hypothetical protein
MVYGLNMDKMNADRVFNLLCLYGNVFKVSPFESPFKFNLVSNFMFIFLDRSNSSRRKKVRPKEAED